MPTQQQPTTHIKSEILTNRNPDKVTSFHAKLDVYPNILLFNPWEYSVSSFEINILNGIKFETSHISSFSVPQPIPKEGLVTTNGQFLNSAVLTSHIRPALTVSNIRPFIHYNVHDSDESTQAVSLAIGDFAQNRLPSLANHIAEPEGTVLTLIGFHPTTQIPVTSESIEPTMFPTWDS